MLLQTVVFFSYTTKNFLTQNEDGYTLPERIKAKNKDGTKKQRRPGTNPRRLQQGAPDVLSPRVVRPDRMSLSTNAETKV